MIINNVLLKLLPEHIHELAAARVQLLSMRGRIPELLDVEVHSNLRDSGYDLLLITKFKSMEDFENYLPHSAHVQVGQFIGPLLASQASLCYQA